MERKEIDSRPCQVPLGTVWVLLTRWRVVMQAFYFQAGGLRISGRVRYAPRTAASDWPDS